MEPGLDTDYIRQYVIRRTGNSPAIYYHGTHFAVNQTITLDELAEISEMEGVLEITGEYNGGGIGTWSASHEPKVADALLWKSLVGCIRRLNEK